MVANTTNSCDKKRPVFPRPSLLHISIVSFHYNIFIPEPATSAATTTENSVLSEPTSYPIHRLFSPPVLLISSESTLLYDWAKEEV